MQLKIILTKLPKTHFTSKLNHLMLQTKKKNYTTENHFFFLIDNNIFKILHHDHSQSRSSQIQKQNSNITKKTNLPSALSSNFTEMNFSREPCSTFHHNVHFESFQHCSLKAAFDHCATRTFEKRWRDSKHTRTRPFRGTYLNSWLPRRFNWLVQYLYDTRLYHRTVV